jgi:hypothetical protein
LKIIVEPKLFPLSLTPDDCGKSWNLWDRLKRAGEYSHISKTATHGYLASDGLIAGRRILQLAKIEANVSEQLLFKDVVEKIRELGFRLATSEELLLLGATYHAE